MFRNQFKSNVDFEISRIISKFPGHDIESSDKEKEKNTGMVQGDSKPTINFDQDTKQFLQHHFSVGLCNINNSGNAFEGFLEEKINLSEQTKGELNWWIHNLNLYNRNCLATPPALLVIRSDVSSVGWG